MVNDLFKAAISNEKLHSKYRMLTESDLFKPHREVLSDWAKDYHDKDGKFIKEFQTTFRSSFWELYLSKVFYEMGFELDTTKSRPDFRVTKPIKFDVEAVVSNIKQDGRKEESRNMHDALEMFDCIFKSNEFNNLLDEAITRHSNSIRQKHNKYKNEYSKCEWMEPENPFALALGSYDQIRYGREFIFPMVALLYGDYYNNKTHEFEKRTEIFKPNTNSKIPLGIFNSNEFEEISAVIFSCTTTIGKLTALSLSSSAYASSVNTVINIRYSNSSPKFKLQIVNEENPEGLLDGLMVFHNPNAKNKLSMETFLHPDIVQITCEPDNKHKFYYAEPPIVARVDFPASKRFITLENVVTILNHEYNVK